MNEKKEWKFRPFGTRPDIFERYQNDTNFRALTDQLEYILHSGWSTPTELREALILASTKVEYRTVRSQILDLGNYDIEETVLDSIRRRIKGEE